VAVDYGCHPSQAVAAYPNNALLDAMSHSQSVKALFKPVAFGNGTLNNRIVMAPMTRQFSPDGVPGSDMAAYYRRRAKNSVGLIVTEGTLINHPDSSNLANVPHFYGEAE
jgi:2,4-dienoyl-CoA reductase-like NADH-dependent reductase (Old Yellow Enzyme family)